MKIKFGFPKHTLEKIYTRHMVHNHGHGGVI